MATTVTKTYKVRPSGNAQLPWEMLDADDMAVPPLGMYQNLDEAMKTLSWVCTQGKVEYVSLVVTPAHPVMAIPPAPHRQKQQRWWWRW